MPLKIKDRVKQLTTTTGTGTITLSSSFPSFQTFSGALNDGDVTLYTIQNSNQFEVGRGVFSGSTLTRDEIFSSSSGTTKINVASTSNVFITYPAGASVYTSGDNRIVTDISGVRFPDGNTQTIAYTGHQDISAYATTAFVNNVSGNLQTQVSNNTASSGYLQGQITKNTLSSGYLQGQITKNTASSGYLQSQITSNDSQISALETSTGLLDTRVTTNTTNIATVSGIASSKDNYQYWTASDNSASVNILPTNQVKFVGIDSVSVSLASGSPNLFNISGSSGKWNLSVSGVSDTIAFNDTVKFTGLGTNHVLYNTSNNTVSISGSVVYINNVSGNLQTGINTVSGDLISVSGNLDSRITTNASNISSVSGLIPDPGGSDKQVQFNDSGVFGADSDLTWNKSSNTLTINGSLAATSKSFLIDHPTKENYKLQYSCLEGPENGVYVRGFAESKIIELPDYWIGLVDEKSITVNLTPQKYSQPNLFVDKVENNKVYLRSDKGINAYYIVHAVRKDIDPLKVEYKS
jgi:hypothetical protein